MERLDKYLQNMLKLDSRNKASNLIKEGKVLVNGNIITKSGYMIDESDDVKINGEVLKYVSRGGLKLEHAIEEFKLDFYNKVVLDIGSSTGGFTDCSLKNGASKVISVDVGSNQMHESLRNNSKVELYENTDIREIDKDIIKNVNIIVSDVSFISITKIIPYIYDIDSIEYMVMLIKPQFECGKEIADKYKGVILDKEVHFNVIREIENCFRKYEYYLNDITSSPIRGGSGNIEYLGLFTKNDKNNNIDYRRIINEAFRKDDK